MSCRNLKPTKACTPESIAMVKAIPILLGILLVCPGAARTGEGSKQLVTLKLEQVTDASQPVTLKATLTNISRDSITIGVADPLMDYQVTVANSSGASVPLSKYGERVLSKTRPGWTRLIMMTLSPGESHADTWSINDLFDFARPGRYLVSVRRQFRVGSVDRQVSSNVLDIAIK